MGDNHTIKDIARHAQVGTTTVSRVLNNHPYVSEEKRERVLNAIEELNYRQNFSAKWLRSTNTGLIGFLTSDVATTPYAVDIIGGAQAAASASNHVLLVVNSSDNLEADVEFLLERQVAGIIYAAFFHRKVALPDNIYQVPTALANCYVADKSLPSAVPDEFMGGYHATKVLLEAGHRRIGFINVVPPAIDAQKGRLAGYLQALKEYDIPFDPEITGVTTESPENYITTQRIISVKNPPTALFCGTDRTAMACYIAILEAGLKIPDDISIVGFDNQVDVATGLLPMLTTIQLPHYEMGEWAFKQLFTDNKEPIQEKIDCPLVVRDSVKSII